MLNIRIITASAILVMMAGVATAQTDDSATDSASPGKPISLLQGLHPAKGKTKAHTFAHRHSAKSKHLASRRHHHVVAEGDDATPAASTSPVLAQTTAAADVAPAAETTAASVWPAETAASLPAATAVTDTASNGLPAPAPAQASSAALAIDDAHAQVPSPNQANDIDHAADATQTASAVVALAQQDDGNGGRDVWYEELLATLGGAFAAASVAWFLIGMARRNGRDLMLVYETERMTR